MIFSEEKVFMNTIIRIQVVSSKGTVFTREKIQLAFSEFEYVVKNFSRFRNESELNQMNGQQGIAVKTSAELFGLLSKALEVAKLTGYKFDPTVIDLLEKYGYDSKQTFTQLEDPKLFSEIAQMVKSRPHCSEISLDRTKQTVTLRPGQRVDLGSIGKGYAIDRAFNVLVNNGFRGFLINAGGDLRGFGRNNAGLPWKIMLYRSQLPNGMPDQRAFLGSLTLENRSIAGSGGWARRIGAFHHLLNPGNGLPINEIAQTYVLGPTATICDVWATALFVTGTAALPLIEDAGLAGMLIDHRGKIFKTTRFEYDPLQDN